MRVLQTPVSLFPSFRGYKNSWSTDIINPGKLAALESVLAVLSAFKSYLAKHSPQEIGLLFMNIKGSDLIRVSP